MAARKKKRDDVDSRVERAYSANCSGVQVNVMDIGKVFAVGRAAIAEGADDVVLAAKIVQFVDTIRLN